MNERISRTFVFDDVQSELDGPATAGLLVLVTAIAIPFAIYLWG